VRNKRQTWRPLSGNSLAKEDQIGKCDPPQFQRRFFLLTLTLLHKKAELCDQTSNTFFPIFDHPIGATVMIKVGP
jgi:hypothetical protein